ncbi:hypothetical protein GCM10023196_055450 [Actinoallomurus vinaceus]|uniref:Tetratricopeptide repeat protein n=1 Tax=Actinoallomurus vinaceus TaxID=1080074 RepID=A0ABP8UF12_9ACTN
MTASGDRPQVWGRVPPRNKDFTGRDDALTQLRQGISGVTAVLPTALHGLGGVGKTQIAIEYAHRFKGEYDLVWWIPSDQPLLIASSIARLAPHLDLPKASETSVAEAAEAVIEALRKGDPYDRWLLIFDNAHDPESIMEFIPDGPGEVLITSRNVAWSNVVRTLTVDVFSREESRRFLDRRVPGIGGSDANALADALGDLPLALDQAGAMQSETGMPVDEYLELLQHQTGKLLAEGRPMAYDVPLTATWTLSVSRLREEQPDAVEVLYLLAFFGSDPIPRDVLGAGRGTLESPLSDILSDPLRFSRAVGALGRYALVQIDRENQTLQVHRLIQALLREEVSEDDRRRFRHSVQRLLAAAAPKDPDDAGTWPRYARLLPHVRPAEAVQATDHDIRYFMRAVVRYLYQSGDAPAAYALGRECLDLWSADPQAEPWDLCAIKRHLSIALRFIGRYREAFELGSEALAEAEQRLGPTHEETLVMAISHPTDLRAIGQFAEAYRLSEEAVTRSHSVFGDTNERSLKAQNSLALDLTLMSRYRESEELIKNVYNTMRDTYGSANHPTAQIFMNNLVRVIRLRGDYAEARELGEDIYAVGVATLGADHRTTLRAANDLAIAMRKADGGTDEVVEYAEDLVRRYRRLLGDQHPDKLAGDVILSNVYREAGRLEEGLACAELLTLAYGEVYGPDHPYTHGCRGNQALLQRLSGRAAEAGDLHQFVIERLTALLGADHLYTLTNSLGRAGDLAALGEVNAAADLGEATLQRLQALLGPDHPMTLGAMANLALDVAALGRDEESVKLREDALARMRTRVGGGHPTLRLVAGGERLDFDFDPPPM